MTRPTALRVHWPAITAILVIGALFVFAWTVPNSSRAGKALDLLAVVVPTLVAVAQYLYARVDRWRLGVNRLRLRAANKEANWGVRCEFVVPDGGRALETVEGILTSGTAGEARLLAGEQTKRAWLWQGMTVRLVRTRVTDVLNDEAADMLVIELPTVRRAFRSLERSIRNEVGPLLAAVEREVEASERKYSVRINFPDTNPYFGLFVANASPVAVTRFDIAMLELEPVTGERDVVNVQKDRVEVVAGSANAVARLSMRYLGLEPITGGT